jgi:hypothetical protein
MSKSGTQESPPGLEHVWLEKPPAKKGTVHYKEWAKKNFLILLQNGYNYTQSVERLSLTYQWWLNLKKSDPDWAAKAEAIRNGEYTPTEVPDFTQMPFAEFCRLYAGFELAPHQHDMADALEDPMGKVVLILGHPESGKSTLVSLWYVLFRLAKNPDMRCAVVTKNSSKAQDLLTRIKRYLTEDHLYADAPRNLIKDFGGWKGEGQWSQDAIMVRQRKSGERDPTVQALGITKHIYGSRLDLLILDDALVMDNQTSELTRERIDNWFDGEARSRAQKGQTVVNGTRLLPQDLYGQWKKAWKGMKLFRQVIIPAIQFEWTDQERVTWEGYWTLDGYDEYESYNGEEVLVNHQMGMRDIRELIMRKDSNRWKLIYQQEDVEEASSIFTQSHIDAALDLGASRKLGQWFPHERLILGVDPATTGRACALLMAVDPETRVRTVIDIFIGDGLGAVGIRQNLMYQFWEKYGAMGRVIDLTVIEENFVKTLRGDETLTMRADAAGTQLVWPHTLGKGKHGKWDEEYGIAAMADLFGSGLMAFANAGPGDRAKLEGLIDDLLVFPWSKIQDAAIALWLCNGQARNLSTIPQSLPESQLRRNVPEVIRRRTRQSAKV